MKRASGLAAILALFAPAAMAAPGDCAAYLEQAKKLNGEVQATIRKAIEENLDVNGDSCKFRSEEWSVREEKHQAWCAGKDAAAIEQRLQKMSADLASCGNDMSEQRRQAGKQETVSQPDQPEVEPPIEERTREQLERSERQAEAGQFVGCFRDTSDFDLDGFLERSATNTPQACIAKCASLGFRYAGLQYGESCLCGDTYGRYGAADNCNYPCTGDRGVMCGGYNANTIYQTGATGESAASERSSGGQTVITSRAEDGSTVTFVVRGETSGLTVSELRPPDPDVSIQVLSATWGANCPGVQPIDDTEVLADDCGGYVGICDHLVDTGELGDPAPGCEETYLAEWTCGKDPTPRSAEAGRRPEISAEPSHLIVTVRCGD